MWKGLGLALGLAAMWKPETALSFTTQPASILPSCMPAPTAVLHQKRPHVVAHLHSPSFSYVDTARSSSLLLAADAAAENWRQYVPLITCGFVVADIAFGSPVAKAVMRAALQRGTAAGSQDAEAESRGGNVESRLKAARERWKIPEEQSSAPQTLTAVLKDVLPSTSSASLMKPTRVATPRIDMAALNAETAKCLEEANRLLADVKKGREASSSHSLAGKTAAELSKALDQQLYQFGKSGRGGGGGGGVSGDIGGIVPGSGWEELRAALDEQVRRQGKRTRRDNCDGDQFYLSQQDAQRRKTEKAKATANATE